MAAPLLSVTVTATSFNGICAVPVYAYTCMYPVALRLTPPLLIHNYYMLCHIIGAGVLQVPLHLMNILRFTINKLL